MRVKLSLPAKKRLLFFGIILLLLAAFLFLRHADFSSPLLRLLFGCGLNRLTGLYCPGCGGTRMALLLADFKLWQAFRMNPFLMLSLIVATCYFLRWGLSLFTRLPSVTPPLWLLWVWLGSMVLFAVLRNIPVFPFTLLAPGA